MKPVPKQLSPSGRRVKTKKRVARSTQVRRSGTTGAYVLNIQGGLLPVRVDTEGVLRVVKERKFEASAITSTKILGLLMKKAEEKVQSELDVWEDEVTAITQHLNGAGAISVTPAVRVKLSELIAKGEKFANLYSGEKLGKFQREDIKSTVDCLRFQFELYFGELMSEDQAEAILKKVFSD